ncbi:MAG: glycosyltransferase [Myxococcota bacterium]
MLGAERVVLDIATHSEHFGYRSIVAMPWDHGNPEPELLRMCRDAGVQTISLRGSSQFSVRPIFALRQALRREGVDVIHAHGYREDLYALASTRGQALVATNHLWKRTTPRLRLYAALDLRLLRRFDEVVAVSQPIADELAEAGTSSVTKIFNGVSTERVSRRLSGPAARAERRRLGLPEDQALVAMVSSLTPEKGHTLALSAIQRLKTLDFSVAIVGDGPLQKSLQRDAQRRGLESHVHFLGRRADVPEILAVTDIYLMTSYQEGLPISLLEGMAAGCAVVSTAVGEIGSVIESEAQGLLTTTEPDSIAKALDRLVRDQAFREELARGAQSRVREHFSAHEMTRNYCAIYDRALHTKSTG